MPANSPHYLLLTDAVRSPNENRQWRFVLQPIGDGTRIAADDVEPDADPNRLELLAVVRGLEALDGPSRVTLLCGSRYVRRGIRHDLAQWRENNWRWEHFGKLVPIRDLDLWRRVDRALAIHQVECCHGLWTAESEMPMTSDPQIEQPQAKSPAICDTPMTHRLAEWGHGVLSALNGPAGAALSRSA